MVRVVTRNRPWWNLVPAIVIAVAVAVFAFAKGSVIGVVACLVAAGILARGQSPGRAEATRCSLYLR
jgi:hypothetical protein